MYLFHLNDSIVFTDKKMKWDSKVDLKENSSSGSNQSGSSIPSVRKETPLHTTQGGCHIEHVSQLFSGAV